MISLKNLEFCNNNILLYKHINNYKKQNNINPPFTLCGNCFQKNMSEELNSIDCFHCNNFILSVCKECNNINKKDINWIDNLVKHANNILINNITIDKSHISYYKKYKCYNYIIIETYYNTLNYTICNDCFYIFLTDNLDEK